MQEDVSTRERIKRAARHLFALHGVQVAVRDVIAAAGQKNASALNYYFGSKEGLIEVLIGDALAIADARWGEALDALEATGGPRTVREVVELLVLRGLSPNAPEGDEASARFLAMVLQTRRDLVRAATERRGLTAYDRALRHIKRLMPAMPARAQDQRLLFYFSASTAVFALLEGVAKPGGGYAPPWSRPDPLRNFIDAMVGMFEAPWTTPGASVDSKAGRQYRKRATRRTKRQTG
jgi:AcrR family transcriptional regulator